MTTPTPKPLRLVIRHSGDPDRQQRLGPYAIESLIEPQEEGAATAYRVRIEAGQRTATSYHRIAEEFYYVLSGGGRAIFDGQEYPLAAGDFVRLPPGVTHAFIASGEPLEMLNFHTPGSRPDRDVYFVDGPPPVGFGPR